MWSGGPAFKSEAKAKSKVSTMCFSVMLGIITSKPIDVKFVTFSQLSIASQWCRYHRLWTSRSRPGWICILSRGCCGHSRLLLWQVCPGLPGTWKCLQDHDRQLLRWLVHRWWASETCRRGLYLTHPCPFARFLTCSSQGYSCLNAITRLWIRSRLP